MKSRRGREPGLRKRAVLYFTAFVLFILCVIYLFQVVLLDVFYRSVRNREIRKVMETVKSGADTGLSIEALDELSSQYRLCILLLSVDNGNFTKVYACHSNPDCVLHNLSDDELKRLYSEAAESGDYKETVIGGKGLNDDEGDPPDRFRSVIRTGLFTSGDGTSYVVYLDARLTPLNSGVMTLKSQFSCLTLAILLTAAIAGYVFASKISAPLSRINDTAKRMASGDLSLQFPVEGYRETRELAGTLNYAVSEIRRSDKLQRELIANVSHDLRTPLTMISGYAEIMKDIPGENTPENLQVIIDEAKHLSELVNDMLDLSRIEAGVKKPEITVFDITSTVNEVLARYSALMTHDGYDISFVGTPDTINVRADRTMIIQVLYNLINNAVNYTGEDKKVIVTESLHKDEEGREKVRITVKDTGEGIDPGHLHEIWDRYYKVDKDHKRAAKGTGIGLSIVKSILEAHSAVFGVESSRTNGSSFWFELGVEKA